MDKPANATRHGVRRRLAGAALAAALAASAGGCAGNVDTEKPVGIGSTPNTLKLSPCACIELPNAARG